ncbi:MAG: MBL fold metallo-hydrolase [Acidobacteria bacterium]|nr:MAG: MBL fold metallo-hydrolase [Acidobacteriota bacterium]
MGLTLTSFGAARTVTGSKHLVEVGGHKILVDCGQFQGLKSLRERNWQPLPTGVEAVVLTHAHLDHCGLLPRLVQQGFRGKIFCTPATAELTKIVLADAGHLQEEDAERANRKGYTRHKPALPLFTEEDAARAMTLLQPVGYNRPVPVAPGVTTEFLNAGHLLGSSFARVRVESEKKTILFGGDLGRYGRPVLPDPTPVTEADVVLVESTYGDRLHDSGDDATRLAQVINETFARGGKVVIPSFALGRVEELLYWISFLESQKRIPEMPVYVDSPMAREVLAEYRTRLNELDPQISDMVARHEREAMAFSTARLRVVATVKESMQVQDSKTPMIVISASGMATGGRVLHHLRRTLPDDRNTILFVGYQAEGTRGRQIRDGAKFVRMHGEEVPVNAHVDSFDSMSAHADANEIMRWLGNFTRPPALTCLVHGEPKPMDTLKARIERELKWTVKTPNQGERISL